MDHPGELLVFSHERALLKTPSTILLFNYQVVNIALTQQVEVLFAGFPPYAYVLLQSSVKDIEYTTSIITEYAYMSTAYWTRDV